MRKHQLLFSNLIVALVIILGYAGMIYRDAREYQNLVEDHIKNTVSLTEAGISRSLESTLMEPILVSRTMANDTFLKVWAKEEAESDQTANCTVQISRYLKSYQDKYRYSTVFFVSAGTGRYYVPDGLNKVLAPEDKHDIWYYNFLERGNEYDLEVDTDQSNGNSVSMFVNFRVEDRDGNLLGVVGVGKRITTLTKLIDSDSKKYALSIYLINDGGAATSFSGDTGLFIQADDLQDTVESPQPMTLSPDGIAHTTWFSTDEGRRCVVTKYESSLRWYLIIEKGTQSMWDVFSQRMLNNFLLIALQLSVCIAVTTMVFLKYNRNLVKTENTDELTGLPNRKLLSILYRRLIRKSPKVKKTIFMFDIDHFKAINDSQGHLFGNAVLESVGRTLRETVAGRGIASRWGGDEFFGILLADPQESEKILQEMMERLFQQDEKLPCRVTISVGLAELQDKDSLPEAVGRVDQALYRSKNEGRNRITVAE